MVDQPQGNGAWLVDAVPWLWSAVTPRRAEAIATALRHGWSVLALLYLGYFAVAVAWRLPYPYPLEWLEPSTVQIVSRIEHGLSVYAAPALDYVATMKTPLYYYVVAAVDTMVGDPMRAGRLVSIAATIATLVLIWRHLRRDGTTHLWAFLGVGLYAASYCWAERWYDMARIDPLFLLWVLAGFSALRFSRAFGGAALAGVLWGAAYFTKQTALFVAVPALVGFAIDRPRLAVTAAVAMALSIAAGMAILDVTSDGWSTFFLVNVPSHGAIDWHWAVVFLPVNLLLLAPALAACAFLAALDRRQGTCLWLYLGAGLGAFVGAWAGRIHSGGANNAMMPLFGMVALIMPLGLMRLAELRPALERWRRWQPLALHGLAAAQLLLMLGDFQLAFPTTADRQASLQVEAFLRSIHGDVLMMRDRFYAGRTGKSAAGLDGSTTDLLLDDGSVGAAALQKSVIDALVSGRFVGVVDPPDFVLARVRLGPPVAILPKEDFRQFRPLIYQYYPVMTAP
jgi:hypothetical protein